MRAVERNYRTQYKCIVCGRGFRYAKYTDSDLLAHVDFHRNICSVFNYVPESYRGQPLPRLPSTFNFDQRVAQLNEQLDQWIEQLLQSANEINSQATNES